MITINKPKFDFRNFVGGTLDNGVKYTLINDKTLQKSFVSVALNVGSFSNPKEYDGLAHFLEHMLFMGSEKYPKEDYYSDKLNELGGYSNAYTDSMETVYYFNVFDKGLLEMFDIFSRFFIDPLFDPDAVSREINAVDSEHHKNINTDHWRKYQFTLDLTDATSPTNTFITGSINTLNKSDIRDKVIEFYNKYYTSNNISICIGSSKEFDELFNIINTTFGQIKKHPDHISNKLIIPKPFYNKNKGKIFHLKSISNIYEVSYLYEIPVQEQYLYTKDFTILDMILTEKSENSLYFHLKNLGYLNNINCETKYEGLFIITLKLTKDGYANMQYCEHLLFDSLKQIMTLDINSLAKYYENVLNITFDCLNKIDTETICNIMSVNHNYYNTENLFDGSFKINKINSTEHYIELFKKYINTSNLIKIISSQEYSSVIEHKYIKSREYNAEYTEINLLFDHSTNHSDIYSVDLSNEYLKVEPHIINNLDKYEVPVLIAEKQWYGGCSQFGEPLVHIWMQLNNNNYYSSAKNYLLTQISCSILNFLVNIIMYKPLQLCYNISFEPSSLLSSININISALNDISKIYLLLDQLKDFIYNIDKHFKKIDERYTQNLIVSFKESYLNIKLINPAEYSAYLVKTQVIQTENDLDSLVNEINNISYTDIKTYINGLLDDTSLTTFVYGNIQVKNISNIFSSFSKLFFNSIYTLPQIKSIPDINLIHPNPKEKSSSISYFYKVGKFVPKDFAILLVLHKILGQKFFDILRTKYQLGYMVRLGLTIFRDNYYIAEKIQSGKSIELVKNKMDEFNSNILQFIKDAPFDKYIETINHELDEPEYSLEDKIRKYQPEISTRTYLFNRNELIKEQLNKLILSDIVTFSKNIFIDSNKKTVIINGNV